MVSKDIISYLPDLYGGLHHGGSGGLVQSVHEFWTVCMERKDNIGINNTDPGFNI